MDLGKSLMFCSFANIFSQSYIVRLFSLTIVLVNILLVYIEFRVKAEILNLVILSCPSVTLLRIFPEELTVSIMFIGRLPNMDNKKYFYFDIFYLFLKSDLHQMSVCCYLISILKNALVNRETGL